MVGSELRKRKGRSLSRILITTFDDTIKNRARYMLRSRNDSGESGRV